MVRAPDRWDAAMGLGGRLLCHRRSGLPMADLLVGHIRSPNTNGIVTSSPLQARGSGALGVNAPPSPPLTPRRPASDILMPSDYPTGGKPPQPERKERAMSEENDKDYVFKPEDERAFLTPEDDPSMLDPPMFAPGPAWWEGLWPVEDIDSLADLERYVDWRLTDLIAMSWSASKVVKEIGEGLGIQAAKNAVRWLNRHGDEEPPTLGSADMGHPLDVENALHRILRHIRSRQAKRSVGPSLTPPTSPLAEDRSPTQAKPVEDETKEASNEKGLPRCHYITYGYYELAVTKCERGLTDREAYDWLVDNSDCLEGEELPSFGTFARYLRGYREAFGQQKNKSRRDRGHGPSIVHQDEV
jgi:hypothetical protein